MRSSGLAKHNMANLDAQLTTIIEKVAAIERMLVEHHNDQMSAWKRLDTLEHAQAQQRGALEAAKAIGAVVLAVITLVFAWVGLKP